MSSMSATTAPPAPVNPAAAAPAAASQRISDRHPAYRIHLNLSRVQAPGAPPCDHCTPADRYQELFIAVQSQQVFADSKTFVDCAPQQEPEAILAAYRALHAQPGFDLGAFVMEHFSSPEVTNDDYVGTPGLSLAEHIDALWPVLTRSPKEHPQRGSALPLAHPYVVPGGRFAELYYWDSYFAMLGLAASGRTTLLHHMTDNFARLIDAFGFVPNGTRTYYLSRSQPPLFASMAELSALAGGPPVSHYLPQLLQEHAFWMDGLHVLHPGDARRRVVALPGGEVLNRYWDDRDTPREESWREDVETASLADRPSPEVYRDLRAACESGWDFSTRWLRAPDPADPATLQLSQICTTQLLPVDLNAFLYRLEVSIAKASQTLGDAATARHFHELAAHRREAVNRLLWNEAEGAYFDYDWKAGTLRTCLTAATLVPLYAGMATEAQAAAVARTVQARLLAPGGLATTECASGQQWDRPNGWAPLQWMAVRGLERYGHRALALEVRRRWIDTVRAVYQREGKLVEKYALRAHEHDTAAGGDGGEYPLQDGFGWTNGVVQCWLDPRYDTEAAAQAIYYGPPDESLMRQSWADEPTAEDSATHGATDGTARGG